MLSRMQAKGLSAGYNGEAVFRGLDLKIPEGSITTLIGSTGSFPRIPAQYTLMAKRSTECRQSVLPRDLRCCRRERKPLPASQSATLWNTGVFLTGRR